MIRVKMIPDKKHFRSEESGIRRVVEAYTKYLPQHGVELVDDDYDILAIHAGTANPYNTDRPVVAHLHGLYWTADYSASAWEWKGNWNVIETIRVARSVTVPSDWVADALRRDARLEPYIIHHGIEWQEWRNSQHFEPYVLWNKNRREDVCSPQSVIELAIRNPRIKFVTTFVPRELTITPENVKVTGTQPHDKMKTMIQRAGVYLSSTKETFGIGVLEAMASGVPVLGFDYGGNRELVEHGKTGYLAVPGDYEDLSRGLTYCMKYRKTLGLNAEIAARDWSWEAACQKLAVVYQETLERDNDEYSRSLTL